MTVLRLCVVLCAGASITGGVFGQIPEINTAQKWPKSDYSSCKLSNSRTGVLINCTDSYYSNIADCYSECYNHIMYLYDNNMLGPDMFDMWNLLGKAYEEDIQTGFEIAYSKDRSSSGPQRARRVEYRPAKLPNLGYNSCRLQNQAGTTIYCRSIFSWVEIDEVDCNDACASFVHSVTDIDKIKGSWTLIGQFYYNEDRRTGFDVIVNEATEGSGMIETDYTDTTTEEATEESTPGTTETGYSDTTTTMGEGTNLYDYDLHVNASDSNFVINIPHKLLQYLKYCKLNNSVTGAMITCKNPGIDEYYRSDCNDVCSHYAMNLAKRNKLDTGIWNLIGTSEYGEYHTAFEIARVRSVHKRRSVKYRPEKLKSGYAICKLQNQAGTTIYCGGIHRYDLDYLVVDCNYVCADFVDLVIDIEEIKGNWTLIGETLNGRRGQTGFEILVEEATDDSGTTETDYSDTATEEATEVSTSVTTETEYSDTTTTMGEGTTLSDDGWHVIVSDSNFVINIPHKLVRSYYNCELNNSVTGAMITCKNRGIYKYYGMDCNDVCSHYALNLAKRNKLDPGIWNLIGSLYRYGKFRTAFEIARVRSVHKRRSVKYRPEKLKWKYPICKLQNQAGTTIYCRSIHLFDNDHLDCNDVCATFVDRVTDIEEIKGNWTLIGETSNGRGDQTGFEILVEEATDDSGTPETDYTDTTTEDVTEVSTSGTTETEYTDTTTTLEKATTLTDDGLQVTFLDRSYLYRPYVMVNIPHKLPGKYRSCKIQHSQTGEWRTCEYNGFIYLMDCNIICSDYVLDLARGNKVLDTGIWNLIGRVDYSEYKTAFEITRVRSAHKRNVKYRSEKLKSKYNLCKLQNQAGTTIYCKSIDPWGSNDELDCYDACVAVVDRVRDNEPIIGNWTLIGDFYFGKGGRTDFEIIEEEAINDLGTTKIDYTETTTEETTEVSASGTTETEYTDTTTTTEEGKFFDDGAHVTLSDSSFVINIPNKIQYICDSCRLNNSQTGEIMPCKFSGFYSQLDCNVVCSFFVLDLARKNMLNTGFWNIIGTGRTYFSQFEIQTALEITRVRIAHKDRSVKYRPKKLKIKYKTCRLQNQTGTTIYCKTCKSFDPSSPDIEIDCNDACATFVNHVRDIERIKGNWTMIGETHNVKGGQTGFEILVGEAADDSRTTTNDYTDTTTQEATEDSSSGTTETEHMDTKTALVEATASTGPCRTFICRSSDKQADRVVVEMPGSLASDQDLHFALSLVPMLRRRNLQDKLDTQIDILSYFKSKLTKKTP